MRCVGTAAAAVFLWCKFRRASLKAVVVAERFCASFDGKCPKAVVLVEGPRFEQRSMESV